MNCWSIEMGAFCCCLCTDDFEEYAYPSNSVYRNCACLRVFFHQLVNESGASFHRLDGQSVTPAQVGTSLVPTRAVPGVSDAFVDDPHASLSRTVSFDNDQRYTRLQRDGLVSRKFMTHFQEEPNPLRRNASSSGTESLGFAKKRDVNDPEEDSRIGHSESDKGLPKKLTHGLSYVQPSSEDEDVCPTCLDEYTTENPKITTRCSHHFHLGCIYEWLERSESCPICGQEMDFCESP